MIKLPLFCAFFCVAYAFGYATGWRVILFLKTKWAAARAWFDSLSIVKFLRRKP